MRGLILFGIVIATWNAIIGAMLLMRCYEVPAEVIAKWKFGQALMFNGIIGLATQIPLFLLALRALRKTRASDEAR